MAAIRKPPTSVKGTATAVSAAACGASGDEDANITLSHALRIRQKIVRPTIHGGERSRSRSSPVAVARDEAMVETSPATTGLASLASVQMAATAIAPAP